MITTPSLTFKMASDPSELEQIYKLNHKTFVGEIPQHEANEDNRLVDRFDKENTYIICLDDEEIVGMLAVRGKRPFSLDYKLDNLDSYFSEGRMICEIRLLAVEKAYRNGRVFLGLAKELIHYCVDNGYDMAIISGTLRQQKLYKHLGFVSFGPVVGKGDALFQPMYLSRERFEKKEAMYRRLKALPEDSVKTERSLENKEPVKPQEPVSFLPGPVQMADEVREEFGKKPIHHRARGFVDDFQQVKHQLCELVNAEHVEIFVGTGTLGNDVVGAQLSALDGPGLIVTNGEFGERLLDHASRFQLSHHTLKYEWGETFNYDEICETLKHHPEIEWLWTVHCETSTGVLNNMNRLKEISQDADVKLCLDCCSSVGVVPVDLNGVYLASSGSGKGLSSYAGLAMVFYNHVVQPNRNLPRYMDLGLYAAKQGVPFTHSSNLVYAMQTAMKRFEDKRIFEKLDELAEWLRSELRHRGFEIFGMDTDISPGIVTIALPETLNSEKVGDELDRSGYLLSYPSEYLVERNWIQISLMGEHSREQLQPLLDELGQLI